MNFRDRLLEVIRVKTNGIIHQFERNTGLSNGFVNGVSNNPTFKTIDKILSFYPDINKEWLLSGQGEMLNSNSLKEPEAKYEIKGSLEYDKLKLKYDHLQEMSKLEIEHLEGIIKIKDEMINLLKRQLENKEINKQIKA